jgi:hypothetical protein
MMNLLGLIVAIAWFYAYLKTKVRALWIIGIATLILWIFSASFAFLYGFTDIESRVLHEYRRICSVVVGVIWVIITLYGISKLIEVLRKS